MTRHLVLMRHAESESVRPGHRDIQRQLTPAGLAEAAAAGRWLAERHRVDAVLCSPATRARETLAELGVGGEAEFPGWLYDAGGDTILAGIRKLDPTASTALLVGHAPGVPAVVYELTDPDSSEAAVLRAVESRYPAGTLAVLRIEQEWSELTWGALIEVRLPSNQQ